ncbi:hypothetical protein D3C79_642200 [compost metagenome]
MQQGHHQLGEILQAIGQQRVDDEAVGGAVFEPVLQGVGDLLGGAGEVASWAREAQGQLAQAQAFVAGQLLQLVGGALVAVVAEGAQVGERCIQLVLAEVVVVERAAEGDQGVLDAHQVDGLLVAALHLCFVAADDGADARQDEQLVRVAAMACGALLQILVVGAGIAERLGVDEDCIGVLCGEVAPVLRHASLEDQRLALGRALDVQRALDLEELPCVAQGVQLGRVEEFAALLVAGEGVVFP